MRHTARTRVRKVRDSLIANTSHVNRRPRIHGLAETASHVLPAYCALTMPILDFTCDDAAAISTGMEFASFHLWAAPTREHALQKVAVSPDAHTTPRSLSQSDV